MKFTLLIDPTGEESVVVTAHSHTPFVAQLEAMVKEGGEQPVLAAYCGDDVVFLTFERIACITVRDGKTYAVDGEGRECRLKQRLYELEAMAPPCFFRINKSALANESHLERFSATYAGAVDAVFKSGFSEYVSRRCFADIKRRFQIK